MKLAATRYDGTNVDRPPFFILNKEKPKLLSGIFLGLITVLCTKYPKTIIIFCAN